MEESVYWRNEMWEACCEMVVGVWGGAARGEGKTVDVLVRNLGYERRRISCSLNGGGQRSERVEGNDAAGVVSREVIETDLEYIEVNCEIDEV